MMDCCGLLSIHVFPLTLSAILVALADAGYCPLSSLLLDMKTCSLTQIMKRTHPGGSYCYKLTVVVRDCRLFSQSKNQVEFYSLHLFQSLFVGFAFTKQLQGHLHVINVRLNNKQNQWKRKRHIVHTRPVNM